MSRVEPRKGSIVELALKQLAISPGSSSLALSRLLTVDRSILRIALAIRSARDKRTGEKNSYSFTSILRTLIDAEVWL